MATLQSSSLTNCLYIPDFIASGSTMIFENATAPTSWTKSTTHNNKTLRIVNGSVSSGGSTAFTTVLATRTIIGPGPSISPQTTGYGIQAATATATVSPSSSPYSIGGNSSLEDIVASHTHPYSMSPQVIGVTGGIPTTPLLTGGPGQTSNTSGSSSPHTHTSPAASTTHTHPITSNSHTHPISSETSHTHPTGSITQDFNVFYRDVIIASKD